MRVRRTFHLTAGYLAENIRDDSDKWFENHTFGGSYFGQLDYKVGPLRYTSVLGDAQDTVIYQLLAYSQCFWGRTKRGMDKGGVGDLTISLEILEDH